MSNLYHLYIDDSGTRRPDKKQGRIPAHGHDYFALGGILVKKEDEDEARGLHAAFCNRWSITAPLHSSEIRSKSGPFLFIGKESENKQKEFYEDLYELMRNCPVIGIACVIDRPGYNHRYLDLYKQERWKLCKTAFSVCVERAAKYADKERSRLKVLPERCNKKEDNLLLSYYDEMREIGMPFRADTSQKYTPLSQGDLSRILCGLEMKHKTSPMAQLADLYLWPMCMGGYDPANKPYARLRNDQKLIDCHLTSEEMDSIGIKYSCWDLNEKRA